MRAAAAQSEASLMPAHCSHNHVHCNIFMNSWPLRCGPKGRNACMIAFTSGPNSQDFTLCKLACPVHAAESMTDGSLGLRASLGLALSPCMCSLLGGCCYCPARRAQVALCAPRRYSAPPASHMMCTRSPGTRRHIIPELGRCRQMCTSDRPLVPKHQQDRRRIMALPARQLEADKVHPDDLHPRLHAGLPNVRRCTAARLVH